MPKEGERGYDELCEGLLLGVLQKLFSEGLRAAQKHLEDFHSKNPLLGYDSVCFGFTERLLEAFAQSDTDHAVVEAVLRGDSLWAERALMALRGAQQALYLPEEEKLRLRLLEQAFSFVVEAMRKGLKPRLGG